MGLQALKKEVYPVGHLAFQAAGAISGEAIIIQGSTSNTTVVTAPVAPTRAGWTGAATAITTQAGWTSTTAGTMIGQAGWQIVQTTLAPVEQVIIEYDPQMVERLLQLDAQAPAAVFDDDQQMMDWLDRD